MIAPLVTPPSQTTLDAAITAAGVGRFQKRLLGIFGLVWAADAMQVLAIGFAAPTIAKEFGLTIPQAIQVGTVFFLGMLIGASVCGRLADRIGRRRVLIGTVLMDAAFGLLSAFAPSFTILLVLRFFTGVAVGGTLPVDYAMMAEFLPADRRGRWLVALESFWAVGTVALALASFLAATFAPDQAWRWIFGAIALPALIGFWLRLWIPESPQYLARTGKETQALGVINQIAIANGQPVIVGPLTVEPQARAPLSALFTGALLRPTVLILSVWFLVSVSYYGVFVWLPSQFGTQSRPRLRSRPGFSGSARAGATARL